MFDNVAQLYLEKLQLQNYRNYGSFCLEAGAGHIVLWGENGAGKTNFLEAVSLLAPGRGLRRAPYSELRPQSDPEAGLFVHAELFSSRDGKISIGTGLLPQENSRKIKINGNFATNQDLLDHCHVTWLIPAMDSLFMGSAADRRKFLDRLVLALNKQHGQHMLYYERAVKARNRLLQAREKDKHYFLALEHNIAQYGVLIAAARRELVEILSQIIANLSADLPFPTGKITLCGFVEDMLLEHSIHECEERFCAALAERRAVDKAAGRTLLGVHRSDFEVEYERKSINAALCSTGEQKALLISLILGHICLIRDISGFTPLLLLDEVAAHLDEGRRHALFLLLESLQVQAIMTGTDKMLFDCIKQNAHFFEIKDGCLL